MTDLTVIALPRAAREVHCPYCRREVWTVCRRPASHDILQTCGGCLGVFVVRFDVTVKASVLNVQGENDRIADEQGELLELERMRRAAGETS